MLDYLAVVSLGAGSAMAQQAAYQAPATRNQAVTTTTRSQEATAQYGSSDHAPMMKTVRPEDMDDTNGGF